MLVYKATNLINGKIYVGATTLPLEKRIQYHIKDAFRKDRPHGYFQEAIIKYGPDNFDFEEIEHSDTKDELYNKEIYWIRHYGSNNPNLGYNLDSGGIYCKKAESTKRKIGDTTLEKWKNPDIAERMLNGLRKGTDIWKAKCQENRIRFECPVCRKILYIRPYEAKYKRYCSAACAKLDGAYSHAQSAATKAAAERVHEENLIRKRDIAEDIIDWAFANKEYVQSCKFNDVTNHYKPLTDFLYEKYGIFDLRSLYICFNVQNKKEFAQCLINIVSEENIC